MGFAFTEIYVKGDRYLKSWATQLRDKEIHVSENTWEGHMASTSDLYNLHKSLLSLRVLQH